MAYRYGYGYAGRARRPRAAIDLFVDAAAGSDTNDGRSETTAFSTLAHALGAAAPGEIIGVKGGEAATIGEGTALVFFTTAATRIVAYGGETAVIDGARDIAAASWAPVAGTVNVFETLVVHEVATSPDPAGADSHHYQVWLGGPLTGTALAWIVGNGTIADNTALVDTTPGSFTVYEDGTTDEDPRGVSGTSYRYRVHLPDGSDPTGQSLFIADGGTHVFVPAGAAGIRLEGLTFARGAQKDQAASDLAVLRNVASVEAGAHGHVGPVAAINGYTARGRPVPGMPNNRPGLNAGTGLNLFTSDDATHDTVIGGLVDIAGFRNGIYGHTGSNTRIGRDFTLSGAFVGRRLVMAVAPGEFVGDVLIENLDLEDVDTLVGVNAAWNSGLVRNFSLKTWTELSPVNSGRIALIEAQAGSACTFEDGSVAARVTGGHRYLVQGPSGGVPPQITLRRITDTNHADPSLAFTLPSSSAFRTMALTIEDCTFGQLNRIATQVPPDSLTVTGASTFGWKGKTRAQVVAEFQTAGATVSIDSSVTMVDANGNVVDPPA